MSPFSFLKKRGASAEKGQGLWEVLEVPDVPPDYEEIMRFMDGIPFSVIYDFSVPKVYIASSGRSPEEVETVFSAQGITLKRAKVLDAKGGKESVAVRMFPMLDPEKIEKEKLTDTDYFKEMREEEHMRYLFSHMENYSDAMLVVNFWPSPREELKEIERMVGKELERITAVYSTAYLDKRETMKSERFKSRERKLRLAQAMCVYGGDDSAWKVHVRYFGRNSDILASKLANKFYVDEESSKGKVGDGWFAPRDWGDTLSGSFASRFLCFPPDVARKQVSVNADRLMGEQLTSGICIGTELKNGIKPMKREVRLPYSALNVGVFSCGKMGTGKSTTAERMVMDLREKGIPSIVFSIDKTWARQFREKGHIIPFYRAPETNFIVPFNFVRVPKGVGIETFTEELSAMIANAIGEHYGGTFQKEAARLMKEIYYQNKGKMTVGILANELSRLLLTRYGQVRKGKREYTEKYGRNLQLIIDFLDLLTSDPAYRQAESLTIEDCVKDGAVFEFSEVSTVRLKLYYAFLLTQLTTYIHHAFPETADKKPKLFIVLEEMQTVFHREHEDPLTKTIVDNLKSKIVKFRKCGVGYYFICHFYSQLPEELRGYCGSKIVFSQSSESAETALPELGFSQGDRETYSKAMVKLTKLKDLTACCSLMDLGDEGHREVVGPFFLALSRDFSKFPEIPTPLEVKERMARVLLEKNIPVPKYDAEIAQKDARLAEKEMEISEEEKRLADEREALVSQLSEEGNYSEIFVKTGFPEQAKRLLKEISEKGSMLKGDVASEDLIVAKRMRKWGLLDRSEQEGKAVYSVSETGKKALDGMKA